MLESIVTTGYRYAKKIGSRFKSTDFTNNIMVSYGIEPIIAIIAGKQKIKLAPHENWGTRLRYVLEWYEHGTVRVCKKFLRHGMTALDIGADSGYFTRIFSKLVGNKGVVFAFEPHPESFQLLSSNIYKPDFSNVTLVQKALSDVNGITTLWGSPFPAKHSIYNMKGPTPHASPQRKPLSVDTITLDTFLENKNNPTINFIKIDIEGAEMKALNGMRRTLERSRDITMVIEFNGQALAASGATPYEFLKQIHNLGFQTYVIGESKDTLSSITPSTYGYVKRGYVNLLCLKKFSH